MSRRWGSFALAALLLTTFSALLGGSRAFNDVREDVHVLLVHLHPSIDASDPKIHAELDSFGRERGGTGDIALQERVTRREVVRSVLSRLVEDAQEKAMRFIESNVADSAGTVQILPLWIQNTLIVRIDERAHGGNDTRLRHQRRFFEKELRWFPGVLDVESDGAFVRLISAEAETTRQEDEQEHGASGAQENIKLLHAPELWKKDVQGKGVVVGSIDSGVRYTHEALKNSFRGRIVALPADQLDD